MSTLCCENSAHNSSYFAQLYRFTKKQKQNEEANVKKIIRKNYNNCLFLFELVVLQPLVVLLVVLLFRDIYKNTPPLFYEFIIGHVKMVTKNEKETWFNVLVLMWTRMLWRKGVALWGYWIYAFCFDKKTLVFNLPRKNTTECNIINYVIG